MQSRLLGLLCHYLLAFAAAVRFHSGERQYQRQVVNATPSSLVRTEWEGGLDTIFRCPEECSRCCRWPKFLGRGISEGSFKCVLKAKDLVPKDRDCSKPQPRRKAKQQFKTQCKFTEMELDDFHAQRRKVSDILPDCGRLAKCCCRNEDYRKQEMCLPTPASLKHAEASHTDQHWVILPDTRQGFASCADWAWDPAIPLGDDIECTDCNATSPGFATRAGYRCTHCKMEFACGGEDNVDCAKIQQGYLNNANRLWYASFVRREDYPLFDRIPRWAAVRGQTFYKSVAIGQCASETGTSLLLDEEGRCPHSHFAEDGYCLCRELC